MSNHRTTRSHAGALTKDEVRRFEGLLVSRGKVLHKHPGVVRELLKKPKRVEGALLSLVPAQDPHDAARRQWETLYRTFFGLNVDLSAVAIPAQKEGFTRLVIVAPGVTLNAAMEACRKHFPCWQYTDDLDRDVTVKPGTAQTGGYARWFRDRVEADEEAMNKSADDLESEQVPGIMLLERVLMELDYFERTKDHLDKENVTLCNGSRSSDGRVPDADWRGGEFHVYWCSRRSRHPSLRSRVAVS